MSLQKNPVSSYFWKTNLITKIETMQKCILVCVLLVLVLSTGSDARSLSPTMVNLRMMMQERQSKIPVDRQNGEDDNSGVGGNKVLSPGGPDSHHHLQLKN